MRFPNIAQNVPPGFDGAVTRYVSPEVLSKPWFTPHKPVIFVNGMMNTPQDHEKSAMNLSLMLGCPVIGVYNKKDGIWADLFQCLSDKAQLTGLQTPSSFANAQYLKLYDATYAVAKKVLPTLSKEDFAASLLSGNAAAQSLLALLVAQGGGLLGTPIYCHSQGNLVTSNALAAVTMVREPGAVQGLEVNSFGSPARGWPSGLNRVNNAYTFDFVSMLDLTTDWTSSKVGFKVAHGFDNYFNQDGEFVVNRFRTGGWGVTFNLDEKGLAKFCAKQGNNTRRLRAIFDRLETAHWSDSDDVSVAYVELLADAQIAALQQADPAFITQLIRLLKAGYTASDEKAAIRRLEAVQVRV